MSLYQYKAEVIKVIDGDTVALRIDLGMKIYHEMSCRLAGINAPELKSEDESLRQKATQSKLFLFSLLPVETKILIDSKSLDKYGRAVVVITLNGININEKMLSSNNAVVYK